MSDDGVKIRIRYREGVGLGGETPRAKRISGNDGGGTFTVDNDLIGTSLMHGDTVRCALDANGWLQVVEVLTLIEGTQIVFKHPESTDDIVKPALTAIRAAGYDTARPIDGYVTVFVTGQVEQDATVPAALIPDTWEEFERQDHEARAYWISQDVDFELDTTPLAPMGPVDYWAPDDPAWSDHGITNPDQLGYIQHLAATDPRVLATIRAGRHTDVLTFIARVNAEDPRTLPKLDRPLLVDPENPNS